MCMQPVVRTRLSVGHLGVVRLSAGLSCGQHRPYISVDLDADHNHHPVILRRLTAMAAWRLDREARVQEKDLATVDCDL